MRRAKDGEHMVSGSLQLGGEQLRRMVHENPQARTLILGVFLPLAWNADVLEKARVGERVAT